MKRNFLNLKNWILAHNTALLLGLIIVLGAFLRFFNIGTESLWFDEIASVFTAKQNLIEILKHCVGWHRHPPVHFYALSVWISIFGDSETAVRSLSALFGIASIPMFFVIGKQLFNRRTGLIAAFLASTSWYLIFFSQEARSYSMMIFFTLVSFSIFIKLISDSRAGKDYFILYTVCNTFLIYTHYFGLFVVAAQIVYFFIIQRNRTLNKRYFWKSQIAAGLLFLPWAAVFIGYSIPHSWSWDTPSLNTLKNTFGQYSGYTFARNYLLPVFSGLSILGLFVFQSSVISENKNKIISFNTNKFQIIFSWNVLLLLFWVTFPVLLPFLISQLNLSVTGIYSIRYTVSASAAFYLLVSNGLGKFLSGKKLYPVFIILLALITVYSAIGLKNYYSSVDKEQWREVSILVNRSCTPADIIVVPNPDLILAFDHYSHDSLPRYSLTTRYFLKYVNEIESPENIPLDENKRIWLLQVDWASEDILNYLMKTCGNTLILEQKFKGITVYLFDLSKME